MPVIFPSRQTNTIVLSYYDLNLLDIYCLVSFYVIWKTYDLCSTLVSLGILHRVYQSSKSYYIARNFGRELNWAVLRSTFATSKLKIGLCFLLAYII